MNGLNLKNIANYLFMKIYYRMYTSILFLGSLILGLGVFSLIPSLIASYKVQLDLIGEKHKVKVKVFNIYKENFIEAMKQYWMTSLMVSLLVFFISFDIFYFSTGIIPIFRVLFLVFILLGFFLINLIPLTSFLRVAYGDLGTGDLLKNAVSIMLVNLVDFLFLAVALVAVTLIFSKLSLILMVVVFPGLALNFSTKMKLRMVSRNSISYYIFNIS